MLSTPEHTGPTGVPTRTQNCSRCCSGVTLEDIRRSPRTERGPASRASRQTLTRDAGGAVGAAPSRQHPCARTAASEAEASPGPAFAGWRGQLSSGLSVWGLEMMLLKYLNQ